MTTPSSSAVDPRLVTALSAECDSIGRQLRHMGQNLSILQTQLASATAIPPIPVVPAPAAPAPQVPQVPPMPPQRSVPAWQPPTYPVAAPRQPWWQRDGVISRLLAAAGVAVTLIGVVMLLVLAAQAGFFGPPLRVLGGALLSGALVFAGVRVHGRPGGKVGAIALAATGFAGMYLDVVAASVLYGWVTTPLAVVIAFGIAAAGVALAVKWDSESLALMIVLGAALLAPVLTSGISLTLIGFLFAIQSATFSAQLGRDWKYLGMARTVPVVLALLVAIASESIFDESGNSAVQLVISAGVVAIVGVGCAMVMQWTGSPSRDGIAGAWSTATFVVSSLPLMSVGAVLGRTESAVLYGIAAALLLSAAAAAKPFADATAIRTGRNRRPRIIALLLLRGDGISGRAADPHGRNDLPRSLAVCGFALRLRTRNRLCGNRIDRIPHDGSAGSVDDRSRRIQATRCDHGALEPDGDRRGGDAGLGDSPTEVDCRFQRGGSMGGRRVRCPLRGDVRARLIRRRNFRQCNRIRCRAQCCNHRLDACRHVSAGARIEQPPARSGLARSRACSHQCGRGKAVPLRPGHTQWAGA